MIICLFKACVVILLYLMRTVNGDPWTGTCLSCLHHRDPKSHDLYAPDPPHCVQSETHACTHWGRQSRITVVLLGGAFQLRRCHLNLVPTGIWRPRIVRDAFARVLARARALAPWRARCGNRIMNMLSVSRGAPSHTTTPSKASTRLQAQGTLKR